MVIFRHGRLSVDRALPAVGGKMIGSLDHLSGQPCQGHGLSLTCEVAHLLLDLPLKNMHNLLPQTATPVSSNPPLRVASK
jgi:hypothetical protein